VAPGTPGNGLHESVHPAPGGDAEEPKAEEAAELLDARVVLAATAAPGGAHGEPDLIAGGCAIHRLQDQLQREGELQLTDDDDRRLAVAHSDEIAPANLTLHLEAELFEEALDGKVEARFQDAGSLVGKAANGDSAGCRGRCPSHAVPWALVVIGTPS